MYQIIDVHTHIFPQKIAQKATENIGDFYKLSMDTHGTVENLIKRMEENEISISIVNSCATTSEQVSAINRFILDAVSQHNNLRGLITLHHDLSPDQIISELEFAKKNNFVGIKLHPDFQGINIDDERLYNVYNLANEYHFPILIHTGDKRFERSDPRRLIKIATKYPELKFIAAHFGGYSQWEHVLGYVNTPNVHIDTSSSLEFLSKDDALNIIDKLGIHRVMFGTDYPMWNAKNEIVNVVNLGLSTSELQDVFLSNAAKFFNI